LRELLVEAPGGRQLSVAEIGAADSVPIVFHHGTPGNRAAHNLTTEALVGARAIVYDRPGYGRSDRDHGRTVTACAADVEAIADALGLDAFAVFGSSGGGPHALACGALLGTRVTRVAVVAGFAPADDPFFDFFAGMSDLNIGELRAAAASEVELARILEAFAAEAGDPDAVLDAVAAELSQADRDTLSRPEVRALFRDAIEGSLRDGLGGWIDDDLAFMAPWGFDPSDVAQPTLLMQGELDVLVPRSHMAYLAARIPVSRLEIVSGGGHTLYDEASEVIRFLVADAA